MRREAVGFLSILDLRENLHVRFPVKTAHKRTLYRHDVINLVPDAGLLRQPRSLFVEPFNGSQIGPRWQRLMFGSNALETNRAHSALVAYHPRSFRSLDGIFVLGAIVRKVLALGSVIRTVLRANRLTCRRRSASALSDINRDSIRVPIGSFSRKVFGDVVRAVSPSLRRNPVTVGGPILRCPLPVPRLPFFVRHLLIVTQAQPEYQSQLRAYAA